MVNRSAQLADRQDRLGIKDGDRDAGDNWPDRFEGEWLPDRDG
ncbi:MAG: hypothetical protein ACP5D7_23365 [Limnospira sp.]